MSFDLFAWKRPAVESEDEAMALVERYGTRGDVTVFEPSEDVARFYDELMERYPSVDRESPPEEDPWASAPEPSDRVVVMNLRWRSPDETLDAIVELARKYDLVLYDPQGPSLHSPEQPDPPRDIGGEARHAAKTLVVGILVAVAGFWIPYRILAWPVIAAGGFLALMSVYTLVVLWKPEWDPDLPAR